jgi:hypothetical protein
MMIETGSPSRSFGLEPEIQETKSAKKDKKDRNLGRACVAIRREPEKDFNEIHVQPRSPYWIQPRGIGNRLT